MDQIDVSTPFNSTSANTSRATAAPFNEEVITIQGPKNSDSLFYDMTKKKYLYIFNHFKFRHAPEFGIEKPKDRVGTHFDVKILDDTFTSLGFIVKNHQDYTYSKIISVVEKLSKQDHKDTSCVALAILTHGSKDGYLFAEDKPYQLKQITGLLEHQKLVLIPKLLFLQIAHMLNNSIKLHDNQYIYQIEMATILLFSEAALRLQISVVMDSLPQLGVFQRSSGWRTSITRFTSSMNSQIQRIYASIRSQTIRTSCDASAIDSESYTNGACRGHALDQGLTVVIDGITRNLIHVPSHIDFLILHSAADGHVSFRCDEAGSWLIQSLCDVIKEYHHHMDLLQMITLVNRRVSFYTAYNKDLVELNNKKQSIEARFTLTKLLKL